MIPLLLIIPLVFALLSVLLPRLPIKAIAIPGLVLQLIASIQLSVHTYKHGASDYALGSWEAPLGIALHANGFTVTLLTLTAFIAIVCAVYALIYLKRYEHEQRYFWPLFWFLLASLNGIWLSGDLFNLYVGLELLTFSAVGMVALTANKASLQAAIRYLFAALLGSLGYLAGVALLYGQYGTLSIQEIALISTSDAPTQVALALMTVGLLMKTAIFPLHYWLPPAHGGALAPVSALLSALVVKASFYILAVLWLQLAPDAISPAAAQVLGALGAGAILWGSWCAFRQPDIKMLVAYSTVAQLGYLMFVFPLSIGTSAAAAELAWQGTVLHLLAHAFAKAAMFLSVGTLVLAIGHQGIKDLAGVSHRVPLALFSFGLSAVSLMGLPPSGGFNAKWLLLQSALSSGQWWWFIFILGGGLLTAAYVFRVFSVSFIEEARHKFAPTHWLLDVSALTLAAAAILLGFVSQWPLTLMELVPGVQS
ncbi:complex I subunit 5 family protein [Aliidiomarina haloalkalitolerans]|uniref:Hydrogenase 4 subunit B n=1 Tax=Aliidiomarina haloalkalitolerans TaxID=859059 RepID=A0A432VRB1_9GAMM|nr:proton-conducting transporter membrane subunit [Aliidiomarina haloalkalitolerans]RUO18713.1 hydrogenase 4 subunit B [Aliidiomarina haloalkalitolerans]